MFIRGQLAGLFGVPHWASVSFATLTIRKLGKMKRSEILLTLFILSLHLHPMTRPLSELWRKDPGRRLELDERGMFFCTSF